MLQASITSKKKAQALFTLTLLVATTVTGLLLLNSACADPFPRTFLPRIEINSDGSITPDTGYIARSGDTYTLTSDITDQYWIDICRSNIVFDGQGHTLRITTADNYNVLDEVTNVTVKNLQIYNNWDIAISLACSNCTIANVTTNHPIDIGGKYNTVTKCSGPISLEGASENLIFRNNISYIYIYDSSSNRFYENNIILSAAPDIFSENYWGDYALKYPNATEKDSSGIGASYTIDRSNFSMSKNPNEVNIDRYPLIYPVNIENGTIASTARDAQGEQFSTAYVTGAVVASIIVVAAGLMLYRRKRLSGIRRF